MTAKAKKQNVSVVKQTAIGAAVGVLSTFIISLVTAWIAVKMGDPLSVADTMAAISILCGALSASLAGGIMGRGFMGGLYSGTLYTVLCVLVSLCMPSTDGKPLVLTGAAVLGVLGGCALKSGRKTKTKKHLKKYVKR